MVEVSKLREREVQFLSQSSLSQQAPFYSYEESDYWTLVSIQTISH